MNMFDVLPLLSRHASLMQQLAGMLPEGQQIFAEGQALYAKHKATIDAAATLAPKVAAALKEGNDFLAKHKPFFDAVGRDIPEIQQMVSEFAATSRQAAAYMAQNQGDGNAATTS